MHPQGEESTMANLKDVASRIIAKLERDAADGIRPLLRKSLRYSRSLATAPFYLRGASRVGHRVRTDGRPRIDNEGALLIGDDCCFRSVNVPLELVTGPRGKLVIGDDVFINYGCSIAAMGEVTIGSRVRIGPYVMIIDTDFHDLYDRGRVPEPAPIFIEDDVWIGAKASILRGVRIGKGAVVGVGAVVHRDVAPFSVVGGVPAKEIKRLDQSRFVQPEGHA
jgi:acetyltransferase-like isoleucine patch superfamily enzyme